jgi:hypothetical protein
MVLRIVLLVVIAALLLVVWSAASSSACHSGLPRSPLTMGLFFLLAGYYVSYYAGVLRKTR